MEEVDIPTIESCINVAGDEWRYDPSEIAVLNTELRELRRKAWHWDEARRIVQEAADRKAIFFGALDSWGRSLIALIVGEDAEWARKAGQPPRTARPPRPTVVCLCGSTRFWRQFQRSSLDETMAGRIVHSIGAATGSDDEHFGHLPPEEYARIKDMLDTLHLRKIDLSDEVLILNVDDYVGASTMRELGYARAAGKRVRWLEPSRYALPGEDVPSAPVTFTPEERGRVLDSAIASQALSGIAVPREVAERALDEAEGRPLPDIGGEE